VVTLHLTSLHLDLADAPDTYPFNVPVIAQLDRLVFRSPVTFFAGENGTGKSTLLEGIAASARLPTVGGEDVDRDETLKPARELAGRLRLQWQKRTHRGFFLRAEDFFNFSLRMTRLVAEMDALASDYASRFEGYARGLAQGAVAGQRVEIVRRYGENLDARSHGESFLTIFESRFVPDGLYLLDEPDTALSPQRQLALLHMLKTMVDQEAQFIIATQSPILMAFPGATILSFDRCPAEEVPYDQVDQVVLARSFLNQPEAFLRQI
jgi:predicted ATPase